jgi:hypothetical protein
MDDCGVDLLKDARFEKVQGQMTDILARMQMLRGPITSHPQTHHCHEGQQTVEG